MGHVRDLPKKELGVDIDNGFEPKYVTIYGKNSIIRELRKRAKDAERVLLAMDPDREGEAIAYHVAERLGYGKDPNRFQRVTFREVTKSAVRRALEVPGPLDFKKIEAQQARRILDRLVGYQASPLLWKPIRPGLSAGRVQTVALRLICEREDEIRAFVQEEYWSLTAHLRCNGQAFEAKLHQIGGKAFKLANEAAAATVLDDLAGVPFIVAGVKRRERRKNPAPPFTTSTLQQQAAKRLHFSARRTMITAQRLYEGQRIGTRGQIGLITYMRTDSTRVSPIAAGQARDWVGGRFGDAYVPPSPRLYGGGRKGAVQDAHEAVRPTDVSILPSEVARHLERDQAKLYELIWLGFVASQMSPAIHDTTTVEFSLKGASGRHYRFRAKGSVVKFEGFTKLYLASIEAGDHRRLDDLEPLPRLEQGDVSDLDRLALKQHFTQPPARYSEASLVKELEKQGIGRPSTYAQIISVIGDRGYVELEKRRFEPTDLGEVVSKLLIRILPDIFGVGFTRRMETQLDRVEEGDVGWRDLLADFHVRFRERLETGKENSDGIIREILKSEDERCDECDRPMLVRWNRYGRFLGCSGYPECKRTRSLGDLSPDDEDLGLHPELGRMVRLRHGPYGSYVELAPESEGEKPKRSSLPKGKKLQDVDLGFAVQMLKLPRILGIDPATGEEVAAGLGRFGPFVRRGKVFANLGGADRMWTVTLEEAVELVNAKVSGKRQVLKKLGKHPESGAEVTVLRGRFGPYVTDGTINASLPKGTDPQDVDIELAVKLIQRKAVHGTDKKKGRGKAAGTSKRKK